MEKITVVILTYRRVNVLNRCLLSIANAEGFEHVKIIIIIDSQDYETERFLRENYGYCSNVSFHVLPGGSRGGNRNYAINLSDSDLLYFLDDDVTIEKYNFSVLLNKFKKYKSIDVIGGPNLTPAESNFFQKCQGYALESLFGTFRISRRYKGSGKDKVIGENNLILCNLAIRRRVFTESRVFFNSALVSNEENLLIQQLESKGYKALYTPELIVYHERKKKLAEFFRQIFSYGKGRCQNIKCFPKAFSFIYIVPSMFLGYMISLVFYQGVFHGFPLYVYFFLNCLFSLIIAIKEKEAPAFIILLFLHPLIHIAYGSGFIFELFNKNIRFGQCDE